MLCYTELVIKNNKNIGKNVYLCQENITGIFAKCIVAPKGCCGGQKNTM